MNKLMNGRKLVNALGIPGWLLLIWKGEIFYAAFILVVVVLALGEFYNLTMKKGARPLRWVGMVSSVFIIDYYYVQPSLTSHQIFGCILLVIIITLIWELFSNKEEPIINILSTIAGIMIIPMLLGTSVDLRQFDTLMNTNITLTLVISIWTCDSAAFLFGSLFLVKQTYPTTQNLFGGFGFQIKNSFPVFWSLYSAIFSYDVVYFIYNFFSVVHFAIFNL